ncbi:MAG: hypothetical protein IPK98_13765 [Chloracidobacterium sp.]|nr:hypothetical protein [Chloracidobacterium sp.]
MFNLIRATTSGTGTFTPVSGIGHRQNFNFYNPALSRRQFLAVRVDFNLTKNHSLENVFNYQPFRSNVDLLNGVDPAFPGLTNSGSQIRTVTQIRPHCVRALARIRWHTDLVFSKLFGNRTLFSRGVESSLIIPGGFTFGLGAGQRARRYEMHTAAVRRRSMTLQTLLLGSPATTLSISADNSNGLKQISATTAQAASADCFGINATLDPANALFNSANQPVNFPGATTTDLANAAGLYATLTGRISGYANTGYLGGDGKYVASGPRVLQGSVNKPWVYLRRTHGVFVQI